MKRNGRPFEPVRLLTGKYGILLLTALHVCLACVVLTLSNFWAYLDITGPETNTDYMTFFLPDYRFGFVSRALIGSIIYLFTKHPTVRMIATLLYIFLFISCILFCFLQALIVKRALLRADYATLLLSYLFFLNKAFWWDSFCLIGLLDVFLTLLSLLFLLCVENNRTLGFYLAPFVCIVGLLIHTAYFFVGFPVVAAILWLELLQEGKPDRKTAVLFTAACVASVALFLLFTLFTQHLVRVDSDEMLAMIREKYAGLTQEHYYITHMFRSDGKRYKDTIAISGYLDNAGDGIDFTSEKILRHLLNLLLISAPFYCGCLSHARRSGSRRIAYLGFIAPFVAMFPSLYFSTDKERFFSLCILAQYMLLHYVSMRSDVRFLPGADDPPRKKLSHYEEKQRREKYRRALTICAAAGLLYTVAVTRFI